MTDHHHKRITRSTELKDGGERHLYPGVASVVKLPGTLVRVYWKSGPWSDYQTIEDALHAVECDMGMDCSCLCSAHQK